MIVRIMAENQYRLPDEYANDIDKLDDPLVEALDENDAQKFSASLDKLIEFVRAKGAVVPYDEVVPSDVIVPAPDMSLEDARKYLQPLQTPAQGTGQAGSSAS